MTGTGYTRGALISFIISVIMLVAGILFAIGGEGEIARKAIGAAAVIGFIGIWCEVRAYLRRLRIRRRNRWIVLR